MTPPTPTFTDEELRRIVALDRSFGGTSRERNLATALLAEREERANLKEKLHEIELEIEGYADGAPDRSAAANLANRISEIINHG
jgi:hypothetical protein